ncbi:imidazoleglycerol-phosphate dehydratase [Lecanora helva]
MPDRRTALIDRKTNETKIQVSLSLDGGPLDLLPESDSLFERNFPAPNAVIPSQNSTHHASQISSSQHIWIWTGVGFLDHMLHAWAKHAGWSLRVRCRGDLAIDDHHTTEDTFLALGTAFTTALGPRTGLRRFGSAYAPLDEALSRAVIDLSNRPFFDGNFDFQCPMIGQLNSQMIHHGLYSWSMAAGVTLHVDVLKGRNDHHRAESAFKALALACREAVARDAGREGEVGSTKGVL